MKLAAAPVGVAAKRVPEIWFGQTFATRATSLQTPSVPAASTARTRHQ